MRQVRTQSWNTIFSAKNRADLGAYAAIFAVGGVLQVQSENHPSSMPIWAPWDFSWPEYLATVLALLWFCRGLAAATQEDGPPAWSRICFLAGIGVTYAVLQTRFEYWSQHMFFLNRAQHVVMHHLGPFLIALGCAGGTIKRGMPAWARTVIESRPARVAIHVLQQPALATFLFVGLFYFWLIPSVHFRAMLDARLYALMNWSMVVDGILFWSLVLDPRPMPPARTSYAVRVVLAFSVMFPQILLGALITFAPRDLYPYYDLCGRLFPSIGALDDQRIGGIVIWIPPAMMSVIGVLLVLNALRRHEDSTKEVDDEASSPVASLASRWTGR